MVPGKRRSTAALQEASDWHVLEITATFWSAVVLYRFNRLRDMTSQDGWGNS